MSRKKELEHLAAVKTALAQKYESLARVRKSRPLKERLLRRAEGYRRQAAGCARQ